MYIASLSLSSKILIHLAWKVKIASLITNKVVISAEYLNYIDVFVKASAVKLSKPYNINRYAINLQPSKQPLYGPIYYLGLMELTTLNTYIETKLAKQFICPFISLARLLILFIWKLDGSFCLYIDYHDLNNRTIKNYYILLFISKLFNWLGRIKQVT